MSTNPTYHIESETEIVDKNNMNMSKINEHLVKSTHLLYPENYRMNVLAIKVKDINVSNDAIGYLYATTTGDVLHLGYLYVKKEMRKSGIGLLLCNEMFQQALNWNIKTIKLCTYEFQAPGFYEKLGFIKTGIVLNSSDDYALLYYEKELHDHMHINTLTPSHLQSQSQSQSQLQLQSDGYILENFHPLKSPNGEYKNILDIQRGAISGLMEFNLEYLQLKDGQPRTYHTFVISCIENEMQKSVCTIIGSILLGDLRGSSFIISSIHYDKNVILNQEVIDLIRQELDKLQKMYNCRSISAYEKGVEDDMEMLGLVVVMGMGVMNKMILC